MPAKGKRKYNYMRSNAPQNVKTVPPPPSQVGPWVNVARAEPTPGQRVVAAFLEEGGKRRYAFGRWSITNFPPGIDQWMSVPDAK